MSKVPGVSDVRPMSEAKRLRSRPSETAKIPGASKRVSITDMSTEARPASEPKPTRTSP